MWGFIVLLGLAGLRSGLQLKARPFYSLLAGDLLSISRHIGPSILQVRTFFLWSELLPSAPCSLMPGPGINRCVQISSVSDFSRKFVAQTRRQSDLPMNWPVALKEQTSCLSVDEVAQIREDAVIQFHAQ
jgi:hypothetical protein